MSTEQTQTGGIAGERLKSFVERIERLEAEKEELAGDIREIYSEAKGTGFDTKILRQVIRLRKMEAADRREQDELRELYLRALGDLADTPLGRAAMNRPPAGGRKRPASPIAAIRQDIADGKVSIEGGGVRIEADGNGGVKSTPVHPRASEGELVEAVRDHLVSAGMVHEGGNKYRAPETRAAAPPVQAVEDGDDDMPPGFKGATERQAAAAASRTAG